MINTIDKSLARLNKKQKINCQNEETREVTSVQILQLLKGYNTRKGER